LARSAFAATVKRIEEKSHYLMKYVIKNQIMMLP
jgi:hypothetical protein